MQRVIKGFKLNRCAMACQGCSAVFILFQINRIFDVKHLNGKKINIKTKYIEFLADSVVQYIEKI